MFVTMKTILDHANENKYAVMAINCINMEMARAAIEAAEEMHSAIIIQMGPGQMKKHAHPTEMFPMVKAMAERVNVPVCLNMDHGSEFQDLLDMMKLGFTNVMFDGSSLAYEENLDRTNIICKLAHGKGISVEAELGHVGQAVDEDDEHTDFLTNPLQAKEFVEKTGVDALAVAIGTAHGAYPKGKIPKLDFERLKELKEILKMPLVLHGGSGAGEENIRKAVAYGINKINVCTDAFEVAKEAFIKECQSTTEKDYLAISMEVEKAVKKFVVEYIKVIGSSNRYIYGNAAYAGHE
ncbi:MAG: class II fructose-bisphosphate aldolase [Clostridiaceae bacterium]